MDSLYKIESVCSLGLSRLSVLCGTIGLSQYRTITLVAIDGSEARRAWGSKGLSWSLPTSILPTSIFPTSDFPLLLPSPSPEEAILIYIFNVFYTPRWLHRG